MAVERHVQVSNSELDSLEAALSWVVRQVDAGEFKDSAVLKITIEQYLMAATDEDDDEGDKWQTGWTASIAGSVERT